MLNCADFYGFSYKYISAWVEVKNDSTKLVHALKSVKDVSSNSAKCYNEVFINEGGIACQKLSIVTASEVIKYVLFDKSPSFGKSVGFSNCSTVGDSNSVYVDINLNSSPSVSYRIGIPASTHGNLLAGDTVFGGCSWSSDERYFCYIAKAPKSATDDKAMEWDQENEDWGEKYVGVSQLVICVLNIMDGVVTVIPNSSELSGCPSQPTFISYDDRYEVVYTLWDVQPRRLGILGCWHRKCSLVRVDITGILSEKAQSSVVNHVCITSDIALARSARCSPCYILNNRKQRSLVFLGRKDLLYVHHACWELFAIDIYEDDDNVIQYTQPRVLVEVVKMASSNEFPGIFTDHLPGRCFISTACDHTAPINANDLSVLFNTYWRCTDAVCAVKLFPESLVPVVRVPFAHSSVDCSNLNAVCITLLSCTNSYAVCQLSSPNTPCALGVFDMKASSVCDDGERKTNPNQLTNMAAPPPPMHMVRQWKGGKAIDCANNTLSLIRDVLWRVDTFNTEGIDFQSISIYPSGLINTDKWQETGIPAILVPHGGPHSVFTISFPAIAPYLYLANDLQCCVVLINFRGSIGYGDASVQALPGHIGEVDVADIVTVANFITSTKRIDLPMVDRARLAIIGGSHGGYLTGQMIGQFPDMFRVAIMRNPVTNIPAMFTVSDIPDWCVVEAMGVHSGDDLNYALDQFSGPSHAQIIGMHEKSPIRLVENIETPLLMLLGAKDRRVPMCQGIEFYWALRSHYSRKKKEDLVKMYIFNEDTHAIELPASEVKHWSMVKDWFQKYL